MISNFQVFLLKKQDVGNIISYLLPTPLLCDEGTSAGINGPSTYISIIRKSIPINRKTDFYITSDNQVSLRALESDTLNSNLIRECHINLQKPSLNTVLLLCGNLDLEMARKGQLPNS